MTLFVNNHSRFQALALIHTPSMERFSCELGIALLILRGMPQIADHPISESQIISGFDILCSLTYLDKVGTYYLIVL